MVFHIYYLSTQVHIFIRCLVQALFSLGLCKLVANCPMIFVTYFATCLSLFYKCSDSWKLAALRKISSVFWKNKVATLARAQTGWRSQTGTPLRQSGTNNHLKLRRFTAFHIFPPLIRNIVLITCLVSVLMKIGLIWCTLIALNWLAPRPLMSFLRLTLGVWHDVWDNENLFDLMWL